MARSSDRHSRPTKPVIEVPRPDLEVAVEDIDDNFHEWDDLAEGTPPRAAAPAVARTATRHDPLTTELLAEVTRRPDTEPPPEPDDRPTTRIPRISRNIVRKPK
ncbi:MAG: hypothetical protein ABI867_07530 [Kofleriaceae bacterium]